MQTGLLGIPWPAAQERPARPSSGRMVEWLQGPDVVAPDGAVFSWVNPEHQGYVYPEAAAWLLGFLSRRLPFWESRRARIARGLASSFSKHGFPGRDGTQYVFDTAIVLEALIEHVEAGGTLPDGILLGDLFDFIRETLELRAGTDRRPAAPSHWSETYGCHLLRVAPVLLRYGRHCHRGMPAGACANAAVHRLLAQLTEDLLPLLEHGRFLTHAGSRTCYTHAHCYAAEGLLGIVRTNGEARTQITPSRGELYQALGECAQWLGGIPQADGGIPAFHGGRGASESRTDSTAQAIRLWAALDRGQFAPQINAGLRFLARVQHPCGGLTYSLQSKDVNTWATVFAADALSVARSHLTNGTGELILGRR